METFFIGLFVVGALGFAIWSFRDSLIDWLASGGQPGDGGSDFDITHHGHDSHSHDHSDDHHFDSGDSGGGDGDF